jgi:hypothetical protein
MNPLWYGLLGLLLIVGLPWMVWAMVQEWRRLQVWEAWIQMPSAHPVPPWEVPIHYDRGEDCEAFRTHMIQGDLKEGRPLSLLVCQGRYSWWELILRSSRKTRQFLKNGVDYLREWVFWAGRASGLRPPTGLAELGQLQQQLSDLRRQREEVLQPPPPSRLQEWLGRMRAAERLKEIDAEIANVTQKLTVLEECIRQSRSADAAADDERKRRA